MSIVIYDLTEIKFPNIVASLSLERYQNCLFIGYFTKEDNISLDGIQSENDEVDEEPESLIEVIETFDAYLDQIDMTNIHTVFLRSDDPIILMYLINKYSHLKQAVKPYLGDGEYYSIEPPICIPKIVYPPYSEW